MSESEHRALRAPIRYKQFIAVFVGGAITVFGLLYQQMWTHSGGFDFYAFEYWGPRAFGIVVVTTALGFFVVNRAWKTRVAFGAVAGLTLSFLYIWVTN